MSPGTNLWTSCWQPHAGQRLPGSRRRVPLAVTARRGGPFGPDVVAVDVAVGVHNVASRPVVPSSTPLCVGPEIRRIVDSARTVVDFYDAAGAFPQAVPVAVLPRVKPTVVDHDCEVRLIGCDVGDGDLVAGAVRFYAVAGGVRQADRLRISDGGLSCDSR